MLYKYEIREHIISSINRLLYSDIKSCMLCSGKLSSKGYMICDVCNNDILRHGINLCKICGKQSTDNICSTCMKYERPYDGGAVIFIYEGKIINMMHEFKDGANFRIGRFFANSMAVRFLSLDWSVDIVTSVPANPLRSISRMYDPVKRLAKCFARETSLIYNNNCLKRTKLDKPMRKAGIKERMNRAKENYAYKTADIKGKNILIIDDVTTTGATLHTCADILKSHGANKVYVMSAAGSIAR